MAEVLENHPAIVELALHAVLEWKRRVSWR